MEVPYLSSEWFQAAHEHLPPVLGDGPPLECRLQFDAEASGGHLRWGLVVAGRTVELDAGELADADLELQHSLSHAWQVFTTQVDGAEALAGYTVIEEQPSGRYVGPPAPMELGQRTELHELPMFPGASLEAQYEYTRGPFGPVPFFISFVDGKVEAMELARRADPDIVVEATFLQMAQVRRGDITILDALASGTKVRGGEGPLALLGGISESPEFHRAEMACGRSGLALAALGEAGADPAYSAAMAELRSMTGPPVGL